ncbi:MAG: hypothetical protein GF364_08560 [Candidatus Lokiarchaeota archaeon]|nr:hypothetical protein [Candidatus Lokiarchaeota archaeon]
MEEYRDNNRDSGVNSKSDSAFFERHSRLRKFLKIMLILGIVVLCLNHASFLRYRSILRKGEQPEAYDVISLELIIEGGGRLAWSPDPDIIFYDKIDEEAGLLRDHHVYNIYKYNFSSDSSSKVIPTDDSSAPPGNKGQPAVSPNGEWLIFQGEYENHEASRYWSDPGRGKHNNLWVMNLSSSEIFQLTDYDIDQGVLHPHFNPTGDKIVFSHLYSDKGWTGSWQIHVADFYIDEGVPKLDNITSLKPGAEEGEDTIFYETHDFSADGSKILFTSDFKIGAMGLSEIYTYDLYTEELVQLTNSWECMDEHANFSPDGEKIVWMSKMQQQWSPYKTDLFLMDKDGNNKTLLVKSPGGVIADNDWSPDGTKIAFTNLNNYQNTEHDIYLVTLKG